MFGSLKGMNECKGHDNNKSIPEVRTDVDVSDTFHSDNTCYKILGADIDIFEICDVSKTHCPITSWFLECIAMSFKTFRKVAKQRNKTLYERKLTDYTCIAWLWGKYGI